MMGYYSCSDEIGKTMVVYALLVREDYVGSELVGVYASREEALRYIAARPLTSDDLSYGVLACELGAEVDDLEAEWID